MVWITKVQNSLIYLKFCEGYLQRFGWLELPKIIQFSEFTCINKDSQNLFPQQMNKKMLI